MSETGKVSDSPWALYQRPFQVRSSQMGKADGSDLEKDFDYQEYAAKPGEARGLGLRQIGRASCRERVSY